MKELTCSLTGTMQIKRNATFYCGRNKFIVNRAIRENQKFVRVPKDAKAYDYSFCFEGLATANGRKIKLVSDGYFTTGTIELHRAQRLLLVTELDANCKEYEFLFC